MKLVILDGPMKGQQFPITKTSTIIGRKEDADISLSLDGRLSRFHCQILNINNRFFLEDLASGNGTWLDEKSIKKRTEIHDGTIFRIGQTHLILRRTFEEGEEEGAASAQKKSSSSTRGQITTRIPHLHHGKLNEDVSVRSVLDPVKVRNVDTTSLDNCTVERLRTRLKMFQNISEELVGKIKEEDIFEIVIVNINRIIPAQRIVVLTPGLDESQEEEEEFIPTLVKSISSSQVSPLSQTIIKKAVKEKVSLLVEDAMMDEEFKNSESIQASMIRSAMCVPVVFRDNVYAVLYLDASESEAFSQDDLEMVTAIANQTANTLENSRLYERLEKAYHDLKKAQEQLIKAEKLSIIGTLATSIAHDIGNIVNPVLGSYDMILESEDIDPWFKDIFQKQMKGLRTLTNQLKSFSRPQAFQITSVDINQRIQDNLSLVQKEASHRGVKIELELDSELFMIQADANRLDQVFVNLILNAIDAMKNQKNGHFLIRSYQDQHYVYIAFQDNGSGIEAENLKAIFEPFFTTKGVSGTGMGLFNCKKIIEEEHQGKITVTSEVEKGTCFTVQLPKEREER